MSFMKWKHRKPPEGLLESQFLLCFMPHPCIYKASCQYAHSEAELNEWKHRLQLSGNAIEYVDVIGKGVEYYREDIFKKLNGLSLNGANDSESSINNRTVLVELSGEACVLCDENMFIMHVEKEKELSWLFHIRLFQQRKGQIKKLERVFLLDSSNEFCLTNVFYKEGCLVNLPKYCNLWENTVNAVSDVFVNLHFYATKYGNYHTEIIFDFGDYPKLHRKVAVQVASEDMLVKLMAFDPKKYGINELTWLEEHEIILSDGTKQPARFGIEYVLPKNIGMLVEFGAFKHLDAHLSKHNYRQRLHTLLHIEEYQRRAQLQRYSFHVEDFKGCLEASKDDRYLAKVLFDEFALEDLVKIVGRNGKLLIRVNEYIHEGEVMKEPIIYESIIVKFFKCHLHLNLNKELYDLVMTSAIPVNIDACFCLVDIFQPIHNAVENIDLDLIFPDLSNYNTLPYQHVTSHDQLMSDEQMRAMEIICEHPKEKPLVLLLGPFGSGKTKTIATTVKNLVMNKTQPVRILICTHSNSAADLYIEEYFHPLHDINNFNKDLIPLRINWEYRYISAISERVLTYCLQDYTTGLFRAPTQDDLDSHCIVVSTLVTARMLTQLHLPDNYFTHIFIDEAAQAMEVESLVPLLLVGKETTVVLAGDHMQMGESLLSNTAKKLGLGVSLLERLFKFYPTGNEYKLQLMENFRSYKEIVDLSSNLFYEGSLDSSKVRSDDTPYPIKFYQVCGEEKLSTENPTFENVGEALQVLLCIEQIMNEWKKEGLTYDLSSICVITHYPAQVRLIRQTLRRKKMDVVRVESVNNIQGLEFDHLIITTVRTYCDATKEDESLNKDMGFLTNPKLLNTAITRAKYQLVFVGDPLCLSLIGDCKSCWKTIIKTCNENDSYVSSGVSYEHLIQQIEDKLKIKPTTDEENLPSNNFMKPPNVPYMPAQVNIPYNQQYNLNEMLYYPNTGNLYQVNRAVPILVPIHPYAFMTPNFQQGFPIAPPTIQQGSFVNLPMATSRPTNVYHPNLQQYVNNSVVKRRMTSQDSNIVFSNILSTNESVTQTNNVPPLASNFPPLTSKVQQNLTQTNVQQNLTQTNVQQNLTQTNVMNKTEAKQNEITFQNNTPIKSPNKTSYSSILSQKAKSNSPQVPANQNSTLVTDPNASIISSSSFKSTCTNSPKQSTNFTSLPTAATILNMRLKINFIHEYWSSVDGVNNNEFDVEKMINESKDALFDLSTNLEIFDSEYVKEKLKIIDNILNDALYTLETKYQKPSGKSPEKFNENNDNDRIKYILNEQIKDYKIFLADNLDSLCSGKSRKSYLSCTYQLQLIESMLSTIPSESTVLEKTLDFLSIQVELFDSDISDLVTNIVSKPVSRDVTDVSVVVTSADKFPVDKSTALDEELSTWFANRRSDDCTNEYKTKQDRMHAQRFPSPVFPVQVLIHEVLMTPPYEAYSEYDTLKRLPRVYKGVVHYINDDGPLDVIDNLHGVVLVNNLQIHIHGYYSNNRALSGDTVLVQTVENSSAKFVDISGDILCVCERSEASLSPQACIEVFRYKKCLLVRQGGEYGPVYLIDSRHKNESKEYNVKLVDWPLNSKYPVADLLV